VCEQKSDNFEKWEIDEWVRRIQQMRIHDSDEAALQFIRNEILLSAPGPASLKKFIPPWNYYSRRTVVSNSNPIKPT
jgi:hypothetical protein